MELEKVAVGTAGNLPRDGDLGFLSDCLGLGSGVIPPSELPLPSSLHVRERCLVSKAWDSEGLSVLFPVDPS